MRFTGAQRTLSAEQLGIIIVIVVIIIIIFNAENGLAALMKASVAVYCQYRQTAGAERMYAA